MNRSLIIAPITFLLALFAPAALAHPGHSLGAHGPMHLVASPYHLAVFAGAGIAFWVCARFTKKNLPRRTLQTLGGLSFLTAVVLWGWGA